jgi:CheY-like chemotaxis protein
MARILVIDDEPLVRWAIMRMLAAGGHHAVEAPSVAAALRVWREQRPDLLVTDIAMPDMTGFELIELLRSESVTVPIIAMSGNLVVSDLEPIADRLGIAQFLAKPFFPDQLISAVSKALADKGG